jgi:hypothetical protein
VSWMARVVAFVQNASTSLNSNFTLFANENNDLQCLHAVHRYANFDMECSCMKFGEQSCRCVMGLTVEQWC